MEKYEITEQILGKGVGGNIVVAKNKLNAKIDEKLVALKKLPNESIKNTDNKETKETKEYNNKIIKSEIELLNQCNNEHIIKLYESIIDENSYTLVFQKCDYNLKHYIEKEGKKFIYSNNMNNFYDFLKEDYNNNIDDYANKKEELFIDDVKDILNRQCEKYFANKVKSKLLINEVNSFLNDMNEALKELNKLKAEHNDFKTTSILKDKDSYILGGFGTLKKTGEYTDYTPPEIIVPDKLKENQNADMWSLGCVIYEVLHGEVPFHINGDDIKTSEEGDKFLENLNDETKRLKTSNKELNELLNKLLVVDPQKRYKFEDYIKDSYFKNKDDKLDKFNEKYKTNIKSLDTRTDLNGNKLINNTALALLDEIPLKRLKKLDLSGTDITSIDPLKNLIYLTELYLNNCLKITSIEGLKNFQYLIILGLNGCKNITSVYALQTIITLRSLGLNETGITTIEALQDLRNLTYLSFENTKVNSIIPLKNLVGLVKLYINGCTEITSIDTLENLKELSIIGLNGCKNVISIDSLKTLTNLTSLGLIELDITNSMALNNSINLITLNLNNTLITKIDNLSGLKNLEFLSFENCKDITSIDTVSNFTKLKELYINGCKKITKIDVIKKLTKLVGLGLRDTKITSIDAVSNLKELKLLKVSGTLIETLEPLKNLNELVTLNLDDCIKIKSITPLINLKNLSKLSLIGCELITKIDEFQKFKQGQFEYLKLDNTGIDLIKNKAIIDKITKKK